MGHTWRKIAAGFVRIAGILGWIYIGVLETIRGPVKELIGAYIAGSLSLWLILIAMIESFVYLTLASGVWCAGYIASGYLAKK